MERKDDTQINDKLGSFKLGPIPAGFPKIRNGENTKISKPCR